MMDRETRIGIMLQSVPVLQEMVRQRGERIAELEAEVERLLEDNDNLRLQIERWSAVGRSDHAPG